MKDLEKIVAAAGQAVADSASVAELELAKARVLGKAGSLTELLKGLGRLPAEERPQAGAAINPAQAANEFLVPARPPAILPPRPARNAHPQADVPHPPRPRPRPG